MKISIPLFLGLTLVAFLSGCETAPQAPPQPERTSAIFNSSKDRVWPLLVTQVGLDYPVRVIEKESGLISTDWVTLPAGFNNMYAKQWIYPINALFPTWNGLRMNMKVVVVQTEPQKTSVTINCHYEAYENNAQNAWLVGDSNGSIENSILSKIESQLATAGPYTEPEKTSTTSTKSVADSLLELKKLLDAGAITQAEYDAKKKVLVDKL